MRSLWLWFIGLYVAQIWALHLSEAGVVDWHKPFVGVPLVSSLSTAPTFHRLAKSGAATQSVILTATSSNVLAALNPVDGSIGMYSLVDIEVSVKNTLDCSLATHF